MSPMPERFARPPGQPFDLNNEGAGKALVLRYAGCNFPCPLCYAHKIAWNPEGGHPCEWSKVRSALSNLDPDKKVVWARIQGGEPLLNYGRMIGTVRIIPHIIDAIYRGGWNYYPVTRVVVQTNASKLPSLSHAEVQALTQELEQAASQVSGRGRIVFEASFKSPRDPFYLESQVEGYYILERMVTSLFDSGIDNIAFYPVAGLGPSIDLNNAWLVPVEPSLIPEEVPLFHRSTWDDQFRQIRDRFQSLASQHPSYADFRKNPLTSGGRLLPLEELEPRRFQTAWISRYSNGKCEPPLGKLLRRADAKMDRQWEALTRGTHGTIQAWVDTLEGIPPSRDAGKLLAMVREMRDDFYPSEPKGHYPYL